MTDNRSPISNTINSQNSLQSLIAILNSNSQLLDAINSELKNYAVDFPDEFIRLKIDNFSKEYSENSTRLSEKILENLIDIQKNMVNFGNDFYTRIKEYNQVYLDDIKRIDNMKAEPLKKRSYESLRNNANNFYSIYESSLNKFSM